MGLQTEFLEIDRAPLGIERRTRRGPFHLLPHASNDGLPRLVIRIL
jgi:hypothetical protein